jgi:uncharacterized protein
MLERIVSPFQLVESDRMRQLQALAVGCVSRKFFHHYRGFFGRMCADWQRSATKTVKGLLYAYRSALTGIHLLHRGECVGDVTQLAPLYGLDRVKELVERKAAGREHGEMADGGEFAGDLVRLEQLLAEAHASSRLPEEAPNRTQMNEFLVETRRGHFA